MPLLGDDYSLLGYGCSPQELPGWLKYLIISACLVDGRDNPDVLLESINTLLEIIRFIWRSLLFETKVESIYLRAVFSISTSLTLCSLSYLQPRSKEKKMRDVVIEFGVQISGF